MAKSINQRVMDTINANNARRAGAPVDAEPKATPVRKPRAAVKATVVDTPVQHDAPLSGAFLGELNGLFAKYKIVMPSSTRLVLTFLATLAFGAGLGYIGSVIITYATLGALMLSGSAFFAVVIYVLGFIASAVASYYACGEFHAFLLSDKPQACYQYCSTVLGDAKRSVLGLFNRSEVTA